MSHVTDESIFLLDSCALCLRNALSKKLSFDFHYIEEEAYVQK
jgi:hypothetical protein